MAQDTDEATFEGAELAPGTDVGGYVIDAKIGEGGMGVVYGARHPRIGKRVAIKVLSPAYSNNASAVSRFEQEARLVNEIHHPNIVDVFQFGELPDRRSYFIMEWLDGESLSARIDRAPLTAHEAMEILEVVCEAVEAAHEHGVVHRDLKSDNIFLVATRGKRSVKLLDFGLAKLSGKTDLSSSTRTRTGVLVGTPAYMAPEQARGKTVDGRTDIYALGVLAYKMLTGTLPFKADSAMDLIVQHLNAPRPSPEKLAPKTPPELSRLVVRMMAKLPEERPPLAEIRATFAKLRESGRSAAESAARPRRATSVLIGASMFLAGVIALGAIWLVQRHNEASRASAPAGSAALGSAATGSAAPGEPQVQLEVHAEAVHPGEAPAPAATTPPAPAPEIEMPATQVGSATRPKRPPSAQVTTPATEPPPALPAVRPGTILLSLERASTIEIDGAAVAQNSRGGRYDVTPGHHELRIKAAGRQAVTREVDVESGGTAVIRIDDDTGGSADGSAN
jgi:serine/threonine-protein kinase